MLQAAKRKKSEKIRSGKEVYDLLKPLYTSASHQIRQHFVDPGVILVLAGAHPTTKIIVDNPTQEIFHEIRTLNLLLKKKRIRMRVSTKYLRKEINNLQRQASIIIESLDGYEMLRKRVFSEQNSLSALKGFTELEDWMEERITKRKYTDKPLLDAIEEGEITFQELSLIDEKAKDQIINEFLSFQDEKSNSIRFPEDKFFNLLERIHSVHPRHNHSLEELVGDIRIVLKNAHLLERGIGHHGLSDTTLETLNDMLDSKYSLIRKVAEKVLQEHSSLLKEKMTITNNFHMHNIQKRVYRETVRKMEILTSGN